MLAIPAAVVEAEEALKNPYDSYRDEWQAEYESQAFARWADNHQIESSPTCPLASARHAKA